MSPTGSEAERSELLVSSSAEFATHLPNLRPVPDAPAEIAVFPTGHTKLDHQINNFHRWAEKKLHTPQGQYMQHFQPGAVTHPNTKRALENDCTLELYKQTFESFLWTGIECSNPESPHGERWDQLALTDIYNPVHRRTQIRLMQDSGIQNVRLGMPNHRMVEQKNWRCFTNILKDFRKAGIKVSLDLQHFGLPSSFRNDRNPEESVYLNPEWPAHFIKFAIKAVKKYLPDLEAITLINEPMITNRFSSCFWNEAMPGTMDHERYNHFFIKRALLIAKAAVTTRLEIERYLQTHERNRIIFIHNESCEKHVNNDDFNLYGRFLCSDLILGHTWLLEDDFSRSDMFIWMQKHIGETDQLIRQLSEIKALHQQFESEFGKTMKADTVFGVDYYAACETVQETNDFPQPTSVANYTSQVQTTKRLGLAGICVEYWNRYELPILHTETNFVDHGTNSHIGDSGDWGAMQLIELAQLPKFGIPILGFTWYSLMDQFNWHNGLQGSPRNTRLHPVGIFRWPDYEPRPFATVVLPQLNEALKA